jgi:hypothetical protein
MNRATFEHLERPQFQITTIFKERNPRTGEVKREIACYLKNSHLRQSGNTEVSVVDILLDECVPTIAAASTSSVSISGA